MYHLELLTMKLLGSIENKITKGKNGKNVSHLEITEAVLVQCNIVNNDYQQDSIVLYVYSKLFCQLLEISTSIFFLFFQKHLIQLFKALEYCLQIKIINH